MHALAAATVLLLFFAGIASAATGPWRPVGSDPVRPLDESQGLAVVERPGGTSVRYTGVATIPLDVAARGWNHVGDPGAGHGYYVEPYQRDDRGAKLFRVEAPLVHPMPGVAWPDPSANLPYASAVRLDRPARDIQGCDFVSETRLLCSSDDPSGDLFGVPKPLLQLSAPVGGTEVTASVPALGQLPLESACDGEFEAEGIDYDERDGTLWVVVLSPGVCVAFDSRTWRFQRS